MGYGGSRADAGKAVGQSGDEGIDGFDGIDAIIKEDRLGLDIIYLQAKRWQNPVGRPQVQTFVGSLVGKGAGKGVMLTASRFTDDARQFVKHLQQKVVLIDGEELTGLMVVVEAKRWDQMDLQYSAQLVQKVLAVAAAEPLAEEVPVVLLHVGGRQDTSRGATSAFEALVQEQLVGKRLFDEAEIHAVKWADTLNAFGAVAHLHPGYQRMRDDVDAGLRFHGLVREPEVRLHELHRAELSVEAFALAFAVCQKIRSAAAPDLRPASPLAPIFDLPRMNINSESFSFHK